MAAPASSIRAARGILVSSDEPTIVFIKYLNETATADKKFVVRELDAQNLLVKPESVPHIREQLAARLLQTTFEEEDEEAPAASR